MVSAVRVHGTWCGRIGVLDASAAGLQVDPRGSIYGLSPRVRVQLRRWARTSSFRVLARLAPQRRLSAYVTRVLEADICVMNECSSDGPIQTANWRKGGTHLALKGKNQKADAVKLLIFAGDPSGSRTRVPDVRGRCPNH